MKKLLLLIAVVTIAIAPISAQNKAIAKVAKTNAKTLQKEGWKLLETGDLTYLIEKHLTKIEDGNAFEITNSAEGKKSLNMAKSIARNNVLNEYAESARSIVKGRITSNMQDINEQQAENFVAAFERMVCTELNGEVRTSYTLYRQNNDGKYDVRLVCLVDYNAAQKAIIGAIKRAAEQQKIAQQYGSEISSWIDEGFVKSINQ